MAGVRIPGQSQEKGRERLPKDKDKQKDDSEDEDRRDYRYEGKKISWRDVYEPADTNKTLEVRDALDRDSLVEDFQQSYPGDLHRCGVQCRGLRWRLSQGAKAELKTLPTVLRPDSGGRDDDYLIEIVELSERKVP
mgnify:CR=1 FL=1